MAEPGLLRNIVPWFPGDDAPAQPALEVPRPAALEVPRPEIDQPPDVSVGPFDQLRKLSAEQPVVGIYNRAMGLPAFDENSISNAEFVKFLQSQPANMDFLQGQAPSPNVDDRRNEGFVSGFVRDMANQVLAAHQKRSYVGERSAMGDQLGTPQDVMLAGINRR